MNAVPSGAALPGASRGLQAVSSHRTAKTEKRLGTDIFVLTGNQHKDNQKKEGMPTS
jgi:hypothetical protein